MSPLKPNFPDIPEAERTPVIDALLELLKWQSDRIEQLEDEIQKLKQETRKPKFESSKKNDWGLALQSNIKLIEKHDCKTRPQSFQTPIVSSSCSHSGSKNTCLTLRVKLRFFDSTVKPMSCTLHPQ